jgi:hypothetical protein
MIEIEIEIEIEIAVKVMTWIRVLITEDAASALFVWKRLMKSITSNMRFFVVT